MTNIYTFMVHIVADMPNVTLPHCKGNSIIVRLLDSLHVQAGGFTSRGRPRWNLQAIIVRLLRWTQVVVLCEKTKRKISCEQIKKKKKSLKTKNAEEPYKTKPVLGFFQFKLKMKKPSKKSGSSDPQSTIGIKEKINLSLKQWSTIDFYHGGKTTRRPRWTRIVCFEIFFTFKNIFLFQQSFIKFEFN